MSHCSKYCIGKLFLTKKRIPENLAERVFVLGVLTEPERLKSKLGQSYEEIGKKLAFDCHERRNSMWGHDLLKHNQSEIARMQAHPDWSELGI